MEEKKIERLGRERRRIKRHIVNFKQTL